MALAAPRRAPIIILDEPTSALDPWAEPTVVRFRKLAVGRTGIVITHRLTTAMHADIIHVMEHGRIIDWHARSIARIRDATQSRGLNRNAGH